MHLNAVSRHIEQDHIPFSRPPSLPAFGDVWIGVLAGVISILQAGEASAPTTVAAESVVAETRLSAEQMRELFDLRSFSAAEKVQVAPLPEDPLADAVEFLKIPEGESVLSRPIIIAKVRLRIDLEEMGVRVTVEGTEFCSHESLIPLTGSEAKRAEEGGVRVSHPALGKFVVDRGNLEVFARALKNARTGAGTVTIPVIYRPEEGAVAVERRVRMAAYSVKQFFSLKSASPPPDPSISFKFKLLSPPAMLAKESVRERGGEHAP